MSDPHKRRTPQNTRGMNDLVTKREVYAGTQRMLNEEHNRITADMAGMLALHVAEYHTPWYVRAWRTITRRGNA